MRPVDKASARNAANVKEFLETSSMEFTMTDEAPTVVRFDVRLGKHRAVVKTYDTGAVLVQGADTPLKASLTHVKGLLENGGTLASASPMDLRNIGASLRGRVPGIDDTVLKLTEEAALCLSAGSAVGCAFLMGAASERAVLILIDVYANALPNGARVAFRRRIENSHIAYRFECLVNSMRTSTNRPTGFAGYLELERKLEVVFHHIRMCRNEAGHPRVIPDLSVDAQTATLKVFDTYLKDVYTLIDYYRAHTVTF